MKIEKTLDNLSETLHQKQITELQFYIEHSQHLSINVYKSELERQILSDEFLIFVDGNYQGLHVYGYIENPDESFFNEFADNIIEIALFNKDEFKAKKLLPLEHLNSNESASGFPDYKKVIADLIAAEKYALSLDPRIQQVEYCTCEFTKKDIIIKDDNGIKLEDSTNVIYAVISIVAEDNGAMQTASKYNFASDIASVDFNKLAETAVNKVISLLNAGSVSSGNYKIILDGEVFSEMISCYTPIFYASNIQKGISLLKGKMGQKIAMDKFNLFEDSQYPAGISKRIIDDEGTPTRRKDLIKNGVLEGILYNIETADKDKTISRGNGFKTSYKDQVSTSVTNLILQAGNISKDELIANMDEGILITYADGLFAGINTVSGDFSLIAKGLLIKEGKINRPLTQITIAGNFYDLLNSIEQISNDLEITQSANGFVFAPSVQISGLTVSGKGE